MKQERHEVIAVNGLAKRFGAITAVDDISFSVPEGELFGFLGPNGAGKTTTIRMLTGILTPDAGEIRIGGIDIQKHPIAAKMQMGIIPEMSNVYTELTAKQNVVLAGRFYGCITRHESAPPQTRAICFTSFFMVGVYDPLFGCNSPVELPSISMWLKRRPIYNFLISWSLNCRYTAVTFRLECPSTYPQQERLDHELHTSTGGCAGVRHPVPSGAGQKKKDRVCVRH